MNFQIDISSALSAQPVEAPPVLPPSGNETVDLLRQLLDIQREQLQLQRNSAAAHDHGSRWRAFLNRWGKEFPDLAANCRETLPQLERTYGRIIQELTERLADEGPDALDNDFMLQEFLDRYGMRLAQLGTILNLVASLAEAGNGVETD